VRKQQTTQLILGSRIEQKYFILGTMPEIRNFFDPSEAHCSWGCQVPWFWPKIYDTSFFRLSTQMAREWVNFVILLTGQTPPTAEIEFLGKCKV